jgi:hypothetical protein
MSAGIKIGCPKCKWMPDGGNHWLCSCGHEWNTFDTKGKCPACNVQWEDTYCPACGEPSEHETWYRVDLEEQSVETLPEPILSDQNELLRRKEIVEKKLATYGINTKITFLPYLRFSETDFQSPYEVGCRLLVLWAVSSLAGNMGKKQAVEGWLKKTVLWDKLSPNEKKIFIGKPSKQVLIDFTWQLESVIVLCWTVNLLAILPDLNNQLSDEDMKELWNRLPIGENPDAFLNTLEFRNKEDIFIENIINEMATSHLRDMLLSGKKDAPHFNPAISFNRHKPLNWIRKFSGIDDWDETDTST